MWTWRPEPRVDAETSWSVWRWCRLQRAVKPWAQAPNAVDVRVLTLLQSLSLGAGFPSAIWPRGRPLDLGTQQP